MASRSRRVAREWAMKALYQIDVGKRDPAEAVDDLIAGGLIDEDSTEFLREVVQGVCRHLTEVDAWISRLSHDWSVDRLSAIDRAILRLAIYELLFCPQIPPSASASEAVALAKKYGAAESSRFVNGLIGTMIDHLST